MHCRQRWTSATSSRVAAEQQQRLSPRARAGACRRSRARVASVSAAFAASSASPESGCDARANCCSSSGQRVFGGRPVVLRELEPPRVAHRDAVGRRQRVADDARRLDGVAAAAVSSSHGRTLAGRISGGLAGCGSSGGRLSVQHGIVADGVGSIVSDGTRRRGRHASPAQRPGRGAGERASPRRKRDDRIDLLGGRAASARGRRRRTRSSRGLRSARGHLRRPSPPTAGRSRAPRSTSVGQRIASHSRPQIRRRRRRAKRHRDARIVGEPPAAVGALARRWCASGGPTARR